MGIASAIAPSPETLRAERSEPAAVPPPDAVLFGASAAMAAVRRKLDKVAAANVPVLIQGESGTGKEVAALYLHRRSPSAGGPFVKVSCPAIPAQLLESELFGYERGAFTGAATSKPGRVEMAEGGTLFFDEIAELDPALQPKLLHLLQDGQFSRVGGAEERRVEARVVCASHRDLGAEIGAGNFRRDLYYRINVVAVRLPPLRERREDLPALAEYFLALYSARYGRRAPALSAGALARLERHAWPGNIRELENVLKRYVILGGEETIAEELSAAAGPAGAEDWVGEFPLDGTMALKEMTARAVREIEQRIILRALRACHWNRKQTARALRISYRALLYKIKEAGVPPKRLALAAGGEAAASPSALEEPANGKESHDEVWME